MQFKLAAQCQFEEAITATKGYTRKVNIEKDNVEANKKRMLCQPGKMRDAYGSLTAAKKQTAAANVAIERAI